MAEPARTPAVGLADRCQDVGQCLRALEALAIPDPSMMPEREDLVCLLRLLGDELQRAIDPRPA